MVARKPNCTCRGLELLVPASLNPNSREERELEAESPNDLIIIALKSSHKDPKGLSLENSRVGEHVEVLWERWPREVLEAWALFSCFTLCYSSSGCWPGFFIISVRKLASVPLSSVSRYSKLKKPKEEVMESVVGESEAQVTVWGMCLGSELGGRELSWRIGPLTWGI